jgi:hypothetical protein
MADSRCIVRRGRVRRDRRHPLTRFLTRHNRFITLFGALVVFARFIVKEGLREELKDLVDSVNSAQRVFVLQRESGLMSQRLAEIFRLVTAININLLSPPPGGVPKVDVSGVGLHA